MQISYNLKSNKIILETEFSHREFSVQGQFCCGECGAVRRNALVEVLRAIAIYNAMPKARDVSSAVLAYDIEALILALESGEPYQEKSKIRRFTERGRAVSDGTVTVRTLPRKVAFEELGELE